MWVNTRFIIMILMMGLFIYPVSAAAKTITEHMATQRAAQTDYEIGSRYRLGLGVKADRELAIEWFAKAANQGSAKGQYAVGWMLAFQNEDQTDYEAALPWLLKASGPHPTPHESGYKDTLKRAERKLKWMCRKGVVSFPDSHPFSGDPKCLLARGNRLFHGRDKLSEVLVDSRNYQVERDYSQARLYLEKALKAGNKYAAINLAKIHKKGLGTPKSEEKFEHYLKIAGETNDGKTNFYLAKRAKKNNDTAEYTRRLERAATGKYQRAASRLGDLYFKGDGVEKDIETALMYALLGGERNYAKSHHKGRISTKADMVAFFQSEPAAATLEAAKMRADDFAKEHKFRKFRKKKIEESYRRAIRDLYWVKKTNGVVPFKNTFFGSLLRSLLMIFGIAVPVLFIRFFIASRL